MIAEKLNGIVGSSWVITDEERMVDYLTDETGPAVRPQPASELILVKPADSKEVSGILTLANGFPCSPGVGALGYVAVPFRRRTG